MFLRILPSAQQGSIPIPIPTPTPIENMNRRIANHCLAATPKGRALGTRKKNFFVLFVSFVVKKIGQEKLTTKDTKGLGQIWSPFWIKFWSQFAMP